MPFFLLSFLGNWQKYLVIALAILSLCAMSYVKGCTDERVKSVAFKAGVEALGEKAKKDAWAERERQARLLKETESDNAKLKSDLTIANQRLRDERARSGRVPPAPADSKRPELACFGRAELEQALRRLDEGVSGLLDTGDQNTLRLQLSRDWAIKALR